VEIKGVFEVNGRTYDRKYEINYDYCKGCGICANECPTKAIEMVPEAP
jgi:Pyruvate:ferredoxin oxidoreductase and related 2-oxoacid:ferredoxin oxidoreductases, delta subunit